MIERERYSNDQEKTKEEARLILIMTLRKALGNGKLANSVMGFLANFRG